MPITMGASKGRRSAGSMGLISVAMALSLLGIIAAAAAMWSDNLKIRETIVTGNVDIEFFGNPLIFENEPLLPEPKDVAKCTAEYKQIQDEEALVNNKYPEWGSNAGNNDLELNITITNGYPSYYCKVYNVHVKNTGTVPVKILVKLVLPPGVNCVFNPFAVPPAYDCDFNGDNKPDLNIWGSFLGLNGTQIDPGDFVAFTVEMHVKQAAPENATFWLELLFIGIQWNEFPH